MGRGWCEEGPWTTLTPASTSRWADRTWAGAASQPQVEPQWHWAAADTPSRAPSGARVHAVVDSLATLGPVTHRDARLQIDDASIQGAAVELSEGIPPDPRVAGGARDLAAHRFGQLHVSPRVPDVALP